MATAQSQVIVEFKGNEGVTDVIRNIVREQEKMGDSAANNANKANGAFGKIVAHVKGIRGSWADIGGKLNVFQAGLSSVVATAQMAAQALQEGARSFDLARQIEGSKGALEAFQALSEGTRGALRTEEIQKQALLLSKIGLDAKTIRDAATIATAEQLRTGEDFASVLTKITTALAKNEFGELKAMGLNIKDAASAADVLATAAESAGKALDQSMSVRIQKATVAWDNFMTGLKVGAVEVLSPGASLDSAMDRVRAKFPELQASIDKATKSTDDFVRTNSSLSPALAAFQNALSIADGAMITHATTIDTVADRLVRLKAEYGDMPFGTPDQIDKEIAAIEKKTARKKGGGGKGSRQERALAEYEFYSNDMGGTGEAYSYVSSLIPDMTKRGNFGNIRNHGIGGNIDNSFVSPFAQNQLDMVSLASERQKELSRTLFELGNGFDDFSTRFSEITGRVFDASSHFFEALSNKDGVKGAIESADMLGRGLFKSEKNLALWRAGLAMADAFRLLYMQDYIGAGFAFTAAGLYGVQAAMSWGGSGKGAKGTARSGTSMPDFSKPTDNASNRSGPVTVNIYGTLIDRDATKKIGKMMGQAEREGFYSPGKRNMHI